MGGVGLALEVGGRPPTPSTLGGTALPPQNWGLGGGAVAEDLFEHGLCLPSGTAMSKGDLARVITTVIRRMHHRHAT